MTSRLSSVNSTGIRHQQLLGQVLLPTTLSLLNGLEIKEGSKALCLNCGEGDVVFRLSELVGKEGRVIGIDPSIENIHTARQLSMIKEKVNTSFFTSDHYTNGEIESFDFIHCRLPLLKYFDLEDVVAKVDDQLVPGGTVFIEVINLSGFNSITRNFAFDRFLDIYKNFIQSHWGAGSFCTKLDQLLSQSGFEQVRQQFIAPTFLRSTTKNLASLTLECIRKEVLNQKLTSEIELQVLLDELKNFEQNTYSLISLPGFHQIWGYKA